tara:strand:+ start:277 stop:864 length:588 start_codon:yes stop_codon:yes gene_type:complete
MTMIKKISLLLSFLVLSNIALSSSSPDDFLKDSVVEISELVSKYKDKFESDDEFLRSKMNSVVMPKLDIELMSKIILGKKIWTSLSDDQKVEFVKAFKYRMTSTYMKSITAFDGEKVEFLPYKPGKKENIAFVKSIYLIPGGDIAVDYRLIRKDQNWKVYDIIFDGISLMKNYRADFRQHVSENGIESLISSLKK